MSVTTNVQLPLFPAPNTNLVPKLLHAGEDWTGQPYVYVDQNSVVVSGTPGQGIISDSDFGLTLTGPTAIFESLENIRFGGGYWTMNPTQLTCIGSSAATPVPLLVNSTPRILSSASTVSNSVSVLQSFDPSITSFV